MAAEEYSGCAPRRRPRGERGANASWLTGGCAKQTPMKPSEATTQGIRVVVKPQYLANESRPVDNTYVFAYEVTIANVGDRLAKLLSRHWIITTDMLLLAVPVRDDPLAHVRGPGVVGEHPDLGPGEAFRYRSYCPLSTPEGAMRGSYRMVRPDGSEFDAEVAEFAFSAPRVLN